MVPPGYWFARHSSKIEDLGRVFRAAERLVGRVPPPWRGSRRGRRPKFSPRKHAAVCLVRQYFDLTLREVEGLAPGFLGTSIDHSTVGWAFKRLRPGYLSLLLGLLHREISRRVEMDFYVADSTGISAPRLVRRRRAFAVVRVHETLKLHALIGYSARAGALGDGGRGQAPPRGLGVRLGGQRQPPEEAGLPAPPQAPQGCSPRPRGQDKDEGVREEPGALPQEGHSGGPLRGVANRYGSRTGSRRVRTKVVSIMLMLVAHDLRTLLRLQRGRGEGVYIFYGIIRHLC